MSVSFGKGQPRRLVARMPLVALGLTLMLGAWTWIWNVISFWNPLAFAVMWTGATLLLWSASRSGYPGVRRHLALALMSVPLWWWFEFVNERTQNWHYIDALGSAYRALGRLQRLDEWRGIHPFATDPYWYIFLTSIAYATVIPAVSAAAALVRRFWPGNPSLSEATRRAAWQEICVGLVLQALVFVFPTQMYPFVWIAPFLMLDGAGALLTGRSLAAEMRQGRWRESVTLGAAGLLCGILWEFWNYCSVPSWEYTIPLLGFWKVFEMPLIGYAGYIPFAWSIARLIQVVDALRA